MVAWRAVGVGATGNDPEELGSFRRAEEEEQMGQWLSGDV